MIFHQKRAFILRGGKTSLKNENHHLQMKNGGS
jgi:hypothetical protein